MFRPTKSRFMATIIMAVITVAFTAQAFGQTDPPSFVPSAHPHDFSDKHYVNNGVNPMEITNRLTGKDFLSTFSEIEDPMYSNVRVLITLPAYKQNGQPVFWSPLGIVTYNDPNQDVAGVRDLASRYPIYVFPSINDTDQSPFLSGARQAPLMDDSVDSNSEGWNPLGVRQIQIVNYNSNASTRWGYKILRAMAKQNGTALDGGPVVKTMDNLKTLIDYDLVTITSGADGDAVAFCPVIQDTANGAIAKDAFLSITTMQDGNPLEAEQFFVSMFTCAQDENQCK